MFLGLICLGPDQAKIVKSPPPVYADAATKNVVGACRKAYASLKSGKFSITIDRVEKQYTLSNGRMAGSQEGLAWTFANKQLTVAKGRSVYRGKVRPYGINPWLAKAGISPEMLPVQLLDKRNPIDVVIPPGAKVRKVGSQGKGGTQIDIVEARSGSISVSISIRRDNHLISSLGTKNLDAKGRTVFESWRELSWSGVNAPVSEKQFQLRGPSQPLPLKAIH